MEEKKEKQVIYTIYDNPLDWPGEFVIKRWLITDPLKSITDPSHLKQDLTYIFNAQTLEACREELRGKGLTNMGREDIDDPVIVESWI